jgi:hypothetical protein
MKITKIFIHNTGSNCRHYGRAMAQAVSRRPLTAEAQVRSRVSPCDICGGQSGSGTGFSPSCRFSTGAPLIVKLGKKNAHLQHRGCTRSLKAVVRP